MLSLKIVGSKPPCPSACSTLTNHPWHLVAIRGFELVTLIRAKKTSRLPFLAAEACGGTSTWNSSGVRVTQSLVSVKASCSFGPRIQRVIGSDNSLENNPRNQPTTRSKRFDHQGSFPTFATFLPAPSRRRTPKLSGPARRDS